MNYDGFEVTIRDDLAYQLELIEKAIDEVFGSGYANANPSLVATLMQNAAIHDLAQAIRERQKQ